jgi:hypothetical protein
MKIEIGKKYVTLGGEHFGVRIGSPVHFAFAVKFCNEA